MFTNSNECALPVSFAFCVGYKLGTEQGSIRMLISGACCTVSYICPCRFQEQLVVASDRGRMMSSDPVNSLAAFIVLSMFR